MSQGVRRNESSFRWIILLLSCIMVIGLYYCTDIPAALKPQLQRYMDQEGEGEAEVNLGILFSLYSLPNIFMPFFGGYLVDRIGVSTALLLFSSTFGLGQLLISIGVSLRSWKMLFIGRFIFGLGGESFVVANTSIMTAWFKGKELALAFGVNFAVSKLGSVWNNLFSPLIADEVSLAAAFWFGLFISVLSFLTVALTICTEHYALKASNYERLPDSSSHSQKENVSEEQVIEQLKATKTSKTAFEIMRPTDLDLQSIYGDETNNNHQPSRSDESTISFSDVFRFSVSFWLLLIICFVNYGCILPFNNISATFLLERDYFKAPPSSCKLLDPSQCQSETNPPVSCPSSQWFQPPLPLNYSSASFSSRQLLIDCSQGQSGCTSFYCERFNKASYRADQIMSIPYLISALLSPPVGFLVDRFGYRALQSLISSTAIVVVHYALGFTQCRPEVPLIGQGVAYTFFSAVLWSSVPLVVQDRVVGFAFGIVTCVQNFGTMIVPILIPSLYGMRGSYLPAVEVLFIVLGVIGIIAGLALNYFDRKDGNVLNTSTMS